MKSVALGVLSSIALLFSGCTTTTTLGTVASERKQLMIIPKSTWNNISERNYNKYSGKAKNKSLYFEDPRLNKILAQLIPHANQYLHSNAKPIKWHISGTLSSKPNAHAYASGQIIVSSAAYMFKDMTDDELATLISHEMAHVIRDHSREKASLFAATNIGLAGATMGTGAAIGLASGLSGNLGLTMPHSRQIEEEADLIGLDLMVRAGYDHKAALTFWDKFEAILSARKSDKQSPVFLADHPSNSQRKQTLAEQVMQIELNKQENNYSARN